MSHRTTSERGSLDLAAARPTSMSWPPVAEVAPEHRPRREAAAVRVELVAARPAALEPRDEQVDEPLGLAQLGAASSGRTRGGAGPRPASRRRARRRRPSIGGLVVVLVAARPGSGCRARRAASRRRSRAGLRRRRARRLLVRRRRRPARASSSGWNSSGQARAAPPPPAVEGRVVDRPIVAAPDEDRRAGRPDLLAIADVDEGQGAGEVDRGAEVDRQPRRPQRPPEPDRLAEQAPPVDLGPARRADDRRGRSRGGHRVGSAAARRPRRGSVASPSPRTWRMSSSYLRTTPSVSSTTSGRELAGAERQERGRPVERLGDARAPWSGRPRAGGGRSRRPRGRAARAPRAPGRGRSRTPSGPSGSRSSGRGSGA